MTPSKLVAAYARAYARHAGLPEEGLEREVGRRLDLMEPWARLYAAASCTFVLWFAPALLLGVPRSFCALAAEDRERLLARLLRSGPRLRTAFLGARALALAACYGKRPVP